MEAARFFFLVLDLIGSNVDGVFVIWTSHLVYRNLFKAPRTITTLRMFPKLTLMFQEAVLLIHLVTKFYFQIIFVPVGLATGL